jgi:hypothetical protein
MKTIPRATPIALTPDERRDLEALAGSRKSEARMGECARIVLLATGGMGSRAIGREVGCTPGTASKWRVRYARDRMAGLSEIGNAVLTQSMGKSKLPNGRSLVSRTIISGTGRRLCSRRSRGGSGEVMGRHYNRRRRIDFLDFMNHASTTRPSGAGACSALTKPPDMTE